jgi:hypothetical protein
MTENTLTLILSLKGRGKRENGEWILSYAGMALKKTDCLAEAGMTLRQVQGERARFSRRPDCIGTPQNDKGKIPLTLPL